MLTVPDSSRLRYQLLEPPHGAELLLELDGDADVMRYISNGKTSSLEEIMAVSMPRVQQYRNPVRGWGIWMTYRIDNDEFIGWILVRPMGFFGDERDDLNLEIGWRFKKSSWGKGFATEAARAVMDSLIRSGERKFTALAVPENLASIKVMKNIGMKFLRKETHHDSITTDQVVRFQRVIG